MSRPTRACQIVIYIGQTLTPFIIREDSSYWHMKHVNIKFNETEAILKQ
jgi:hypothetical protein